MTTPNARLTPERLAEIRGKYYGKWSNLLDTVIDELDVVTRERDDAMYVPGTWVCPQCGFVQENLTLHALTGAVTVRADPALPCPNDGEFMRRLTWRDHARELEKHIAERWSDA